MNILTDTSYSFINCDFIEVHRVTDKVAYALHEELKVEQNLLRNKIINFIAGGHDFNDIEDWQRVLRSDIKFNELGFDYFKLLTNRLAKYLKSIGIKVNGSKLLHYFSKAMGYSGSQAFKQSKIKVTPNFITHKFVDNGQDVLEIITRDCVIIDVQPHQFRIYGGRYAKTSCFADELNFTMNTPYSTLDITCKAPDIVDLRTFNYELELSEPTNKDYCSGYEAALNGITVIPDNSSEQYKFGHRVAISNLKNIK